MKKFSSLLVAVVLFAVVAFTVLMTREAAAQFKPLTPQYPVEISVQEQLKLLTARCNTLEGENKALKDKTEQLNTYIGFVKVGTEGNVKTLQQNATALQQTVAGLQQTVTALQSAYAKHAHKVNGTVGSGFVTLSGVGGTGQASFVITAQSEASRENFRTTGKPFAAP